MTRRPPPTDALRRARGPVMRRAVAVGLLLAAPLALAAALGLGSVDLGAGRVMAALLGGGDAVAREIVWGLRAPRALAAFACGGLLAVAGALLQILLRNPLADPGILGISGGAAVGALAAILAGAGGAGEHAAAFAGAIGAAALVLLAAARLGTFDVTRVLLAGVALAAIFGAIVSVMLALAPAMQLRGMLFWLLGDLSAAGSPAAAWLTLLAVTALATALGPQLDALSLGTEKAQSLGVRVGAVQAAAFVGAAAATVAAVMLAGAIGFVGLVVPHALRLAGFHAHVALVPLAAAAGGSLVVVADTIGRAAAPPLELPVGAILALVGAPVLLALLARMR